MSNYSKYRSDISVLNKFIFRLCAIGSVVLLLGTPFREVQTEGVFKGLDLVFLYPLGMYVGFMVLLWVIVKVMPVSINKNGLRCYDQNGIYKTVLWADMNKVYTYSIVGLNYLFIEVEGLSAPITVPTYLKDFDLFKEELNNYIDPQHILAVALKNET